MARDADSVDPPIVVKSLIAGSVGGVCAVAAGHPFDTIKVRLQTMPRAGFGESPLYCGAFDCTRKTLSREGVRGLYRGMLTPLSGAAPLFAIYFFAFNLGKELFAQDPERIQKHEIFCAGMLSGAFTTVVMAPGERIKCLLQVQNPGINPKFNGPIDVVKRLYHEGGIRSIFKGTFITFLRDVPASGIFFLSYEWIKEILTPGNAEGSDIGVVRTLFAGGMAGIFNWLVAVPFDVVKSRLQTAPTGTYPRGIRSVIEELMFNESIFSFYKGAAPIMLRAFPANAACFLGYEATIRAINVLGY